jgi:predicted amino acid dehydrogenase
MFKPFKQTLAPVVERVGALVPGFFWGTIDGIKSEKTGQEVKGLIYTLTETPAMLMRKDPEDVYRRLVRLCHSAKRSGAGLIGLGAYTKIVGDAGVTVNRRSPIPVTTGNSLSACATLWAAKLAIDKMGMVKRQGDFYDGVAMVIGATGSIGAVSAKVLCRNWREIVLVAPRAHKLLELKEEILAIAPNCLISVATSAEAHAGRSDLIITTTSAQGQKILEIETVRPGAVICDVSRPLDISEEDALKRPDVMVIESGEVELPGDYRMRVDIGLQGRIVYACLAETALLAMDGRLESFTLSRNISYQKVLDIDQMAREHGVRLSHITGHAGVITDEEFKLCRQHALEALKKWQRPKGSTS